MRNESIDSSNSYCLVTGASSGIGREVAEMLFGRGFNVIGLGRNFDFNPSWEAITIDLTNTELLEDTINSLVKKYNFSILVNCAGCAYYGLHENVKASQIVEMTTVNITVPMIITSIMLPQFKRLENGYIFNVTSVASDNVNTHGAAYGATKAALSSFSRSVFEECRKHNIKVIDIAPDLTKTNFYRNADFETDDSYASYLVPEDVSEAISNILDFRDGVVVTKVKLQPRYNRIKKKGN